MGAMPLLRAAESIAPVGRSYRRDKTDCVGLARLRV